MQNLFLQILRDVSPHAFNGQEKKHQERERIMIDTFHCFFEQSGTFKNVAKSLGVKAYDYDILNEYGETDHTAELHLRIHFREWV